MESITAFINRYLSTDFEGVKNYFAAKNVRVIEDERFYMLVPNDIKELKSLDEELYMILLEHKGTILDKSDNTVVCRGYAESNIGMGPGNRPIHVQEFIKGTLVRVYRDKYTNQWRMSTNGSLDAYKAYWICSRSIGRLFDECLSRIYRQSTSLWMSPLIEHLKPGHCYQFMLSHPEVHLHKSITRPSIYHVGTYSLIHKKYIGGTVDRLPQPKRYLFESISELSHGDTFRRNFPSGKVLIYPAENVDHQTERYILTNGASGSRYNEELLGNSQDLYQIYKDVASRPDADFALQRLKEEYPIFQRIEAELTVVGPPKGPNAGCLDDIFFPRTEPTEAELDEVDAMIESESATGTYQMYSEMVEMPHHALAQLNRDQLYNFVEPKIAPIVNAELMELDGNNGLAEEIVAKVLESDAFAIQRCLDDTYYLVGLVNELHADIINMEQIECM
jgi:hypothetical protein